MSLIETMVEQLAIARCILEGPDEEFVPSWRITTSEGGYIIYTPFDEDDAEQRERALRLVSRFMVWRMATSYVLTAETWLGAKETRQGEEAILVVGVSRHEHLGLLQRIEERDPLRFGPPEWLQEDQIDETYIDLLPGKTTEVTVEEIAELTAVFGDGGEMAAERMS